MTDTASKPGQTEVWITGIGLATSLGEGLDANWAALQEKRINVDEKGFAPYIVHPLMPVSFDSQIPKKGDQRQMEAWQRIGTYAAGLALDSAGIKGNKDILSKIDMVVAAGGGERDLNVDTGVLTAEAKGANAPGFLNERLMSDLRPTLFLAQLSNLLAGNIAIVHGLGGTSRTFMGEEVAGADAARIALSRIASGESDIALIGGSHNGERKDHAGFALGSAGAFLVLESRAHAEARGAKPFAKLSSVVADLARRKQPGDMAATLEKLWAKLPKREGKGAIITGATGAEPATSEERGFLKSHADFPVRSTGTMFGHAMETQFPLGMALAALSISRGALFPPNDSTGTEIEMQGAPTQIVVVGAGHWRGEGMALVEAV